MAALPMPPIPQLEDGLLPLDHSLANGQPRPGVFLEMQGRLAAGIQELPREFDQTDEKALVSIGLPNPHILCYQNSILVTMFHYPPLAHQISGHHQNYTCLDEGQEHFDQNCAGENCENCCIITDCVLCRLKLMQDVYWSTDSQFDVYVFQRYQMSLFDLLDQAADENNNLPIWNGGDSQADPSEFFEWIKNSLRIQSIGIIESEVWESLFGHITWFSLAKCPSSSCFLHKQERDRDLYGSWGGIEITNAEKWVGGGDLANLIKQQHSVIRRKVKCDDLLCRSRVRSDPKGNYTHRYFKQVLDFPDLLPVVLRNAILNEDGESKVSTVLAIPGELDLSRWWAVEPVVDSEVDGKEPNIKKESFQNVKKNRKGLVQAQYTLFAVVAHEGESIDSGHYKTILKNADNQWVELDDLQVSGPFETAVGETEINGYPPNLPQRWSAGDWTPYIVFYRRSWDTKLDTNDKLPSASRNTKGSKRETRQAAQQASHAANTTGRNRKRAHRDDGDEPQTGKGRGASSRSTRSGSSGPAAKRSKTG